ncbi:hypothetical protein DSO57_1007882 [Entomophthora muscae]|uniref:Uncharacterized protein n=1 Tax=Entomophthora muscae TaxID=34485 RepID=A0ACC2SKE3_9FUNG|nr:hypothetical protein DSO57_1007882 [Entomophthora muscae]
MTIPSSRYQQKATKQPGQGETLGCLCGFIYRIPRLPERPAPVPGSCFPTEPRTTGNLSLVDLTS